MNKTKILTICISLCLLLTGCFEIVEDVRFNKDGSGGVNLTLNLSKSKTKLKSMMLLDSINGYKVPSKEEIRKEIASAVAKIKQAHGITNVQQTSNFEDYIFKISCDFTDVDALNTVISNFSSARDAAAIKKHKHFKYDKGSQTFTRSHHLNLKKEFQKTKMEDRKVFETATFTSIYRFGSTIASSQNKSAKIAGNKKAIMLRANAQDIIKGNTSIKNQITLQK